MSTLEQLLVCAGSEYFLHLPSVFKVFQNFEVLRGGANGWKSQNDISQFIEDGLCDGRGGPLPNVEAFALSEAIMQRQEVSSVP